MSTFLRASLLALLLATPLLHAAAPKPDRIDAAASAHLAADVKAEFLHAWNGYKRHAWGHDDLAPLSGTPLDGPVSGWADEIARAAELPPEAPKPPRVPRKEKALRTSRGTSMGGKGSAKERAAVGLNPVPGLDLGLEEAEALLAGNAAAQARRGKLEPIAADAVPARCGTGRFPRRANRPRTRPRSSSCSPAADTGPDAARPPPPGRRRSHIRWSPGLPGLCHAVGRSVMFSRVARSRWTVVPRVRSA